MIRKHTSGSLGHITQAEVNSKRVSHPLKPPQSLTHVSLIVYISLKFSTACPSSLSSLLPPAFHSSTLPSSSLTVFSPLSHLSFNSSHSHSPSHPLPLSSLPITFLTRSFLSSLALSSQFWIAVKRRMILLAHKHVKLIFSSFCLF